MASSRIKSIAVIFILIINFSCEGNSKQQNQANKDSVSSNINSQTSKINQLQRPPFDSTSIVSFIEQYPQLSPLQKVLDSFYHKRNYAFAWFNTNGIKFEAENLYNHVVNITSEGLRDNMPYKTEFRDLMKNYAADSLHNEPVFKELMLTAQYFIYAKNVWTGLDKKETKTMKWYLPRDKLLYGQLLDSLTNGKNILDSAPVYRQYALLKTYLKKYEDIVNNNDFPFIKSGKKVYVKGDTSATIIAIRKWLFIAGDLPTNNNSNVFDDSLAAAVKAFRLRIGAKNNYTITASIIHEMNVPIRARIQQIKVNMERSRWIPVNTATNYAVINIPEYKLHVYENNNLLWSMNVVVGKPAHETVIFSGNIQYVVFSPYWNVPSSILRKEVLPGIKKNPNYLAKNNMEWQGNRVRQKPGPDNSLGLVKFLFPNSYNIYLHDTPAKSLFGESSRAFSHGCIRLAQAEKFADYLLRNDVSWTPEKIDSAMHSGAEKYVTLKNPEPVFIAYFTSWVDRQGRLNFRKDTYGRDNPLAKLLLTTKAYSF